MNKEKIIFIVEGKHDSSLLSRLHSILTAKEIALPPVENLLTYNTCIYPLYEELKRDNDLDVFRLLKTRDDTGILSNIEREQVSSMYLIFDYDPHTSNACDNKLHDLLNFFNEESESGKLYISYPMIESFRHCYKIINSGNKIQSLAWINNKNTIVNYKKFVSNMHADIRHIECFNTISQVIYSSILHCNDLVSNKYEYPRAKVDISQINIFTAQKSKYVDENSPYPFYILSAIPLFIFEYFREDDFKRYFLSTS